MFFSEHGVPHFHAIYGEFKVTVEIGSRRTRGTFPRRARQFVLEWAVIHEQELSDNWERARRGEPLEPIAPLE